MNALKEKIKKKPPNRKIPRTSQKQEKYLRPEIKGKDRQINMTRFINPTKTLVITAKIRDTKIRILIDSEYLSNFIFLNFVKKAQLYI
jgi:hypothetical protein